MNSVIKVCTTWAQKCAPRVHKSVQNVCTKVCKTCAQKCAKHVHKSVHHVCTKVGHLSAPLNKMAQMKQ
jgi:hypothetical protein